MTPHVTFHVQMERKRTPVLHRLSHNIAAKVLNSETTPSTATLAAVCFILKTFNTVVVHQLSSLKWSRAHYKNKTKFCKSLVFGVSSCILVVV